MRTCLWSWGYDKVIIFQQCPIFKLPPMPSPTHPVIKHQLGWCVAISINAKILNTKKYWLSYKPHQCSVEVITRLILRQVKQHNSQIIPQKFRFCSLIIELWKRLKDALHTVTKALWWCQNWNKHKYWTDGHWTSGCTAKDKTPVQILETNY